MTWVTQITWVTGWQSYADDWMCGIFVTYKPKILQDNGQILMIKQQSNHKGLFAFIWKLCLALIHFPRPMVSTKHHSVRAQL